MKKNSVKKFIINNFSICIECFHKLKNINTWIHECRLRNINMSLNLSLNVHIKYIRKCKFFLYLKKIWIEILHLFFMHFHLSFLFILLNNLWYQKGEEGDCSVGRILLLLHSFGANRIKDKKLCQYVTFIVFMAFFRMLKKHKILLFHACSKLLRVGCNKFWFIVFLKEIINLISCYAFFNIITINFNHLKTMQF